VPTVIRGRGLLVAVGFPAAALVALALWLDLHGAGLGASIPAAAVLVTLAALSEQIHIVSSPRTSVSAAGAFVVASALVGGPLLGALAGAALEILNTSDIWRRRAAWGGAQALEGFAVGLLGEHLAMHGARGTLTASALGLAAGLGANVVAMVIVALDRDGKPLPQLRIAWQSIVAGWLLPWPLLAAFVFSYQEAPVVALVLAAGLLLALGLGNHVLLRLQQGLAEERLRSRRDALTGAPNRYALAEALTTEQARIRRGGRTAALCFLDLDRFKKVNDTCGYPAGDRLLVDVYERLRDELRASDQIFRWGGEEFVLLAPHVERHELSDVAERLRLLIVGRPFPVDGHLRTISGSVGAVLLDEARPAEAALEAAAKLVRRAKLTRNTATVETTPAGSVRSARVRRAATGG